MKKPKAKYTAGAKKLLAEFHARHRAMRELGKRATADMERMNAEAKDALRADYEAKLLDQFALRAVALFSITDAELQRLQQGQSLDVSFMAKCCWGIADAMMAERKRRTTT